MGQPALATPLLPRLRPMRGPADLRGAGRASQRAGADEAMRSTSVKQGSDVPRA